MIADLNAKYAVKTSMLMFQIMTGKVELKLPESSIIINSPSLQNLEIPNAKRMDLEEFKSQKIDDSKYVVHCSAKSAQELTNLANLVIYCKPKENYFEEERRIPGNVIIREIYNTDKESFKHFIPVANKSTRFLVERSDTAYWINETTFDTNLLPMVSLTPLRLNNTLAYIIGEIHQGSPRIMNWNGVSEKTLVLFEAGNIIYDVKPTFKLWLRDTYFSYWYKEHNLEEYLECKEINEKHNENIDFIPCDVRDCVAMNPIVKPYFILPWCHSKNVERSKKFIRYISREHHPTINDVKKSGFYNKDLPDEYYEKLIAKYSYDNLDEMKNKIETVIFQENLFEFFNDCTLNYKINENVAKYFVENNVKFNDFMRYYDCINDLFLLNQLEENYAKYKYVIIYGGGNHTTLYIKYILEKFGLQHKDNLDEMFEKINELK